MMNVESSSATSITYLVAPWVFQFESLPRSPLHVYGTAVYMADMSGWVLGGSSQHVQSGVFAFPQSGAYVLRASEEATLFRALWRSVKAVSRGSLRQ